MLSYQVSKSLKISTSKVGIPYPNIPYSECDIMPKQV